MNPQQLKDFLRMPCTQQNLVRVLQALGTDGPIVRGGHFVLKRGSHSPDYYHHRALLLHTAVLQWICGEVARQIVDTTPEVILVPGDSAVNMGQMLATALMALNPKQKVVRVSTVKSGDQHTITRPHHRAQLRNKRTWVFDDVATTGDTAFQTVALAERLDAQVQGVAFILNRGPRPGQPITSTDLGNVPTVLNMLTRQQLIDGMGDPTAFKTWKEPDCPECKASVPINERIGYGKTYMNLIRAVRAANTVVGYKP